MFAEEKLPHAVDADNTLFCGAAPVLGSFLIAQVWANLGIRCPSFQT